MRIARSGPTAVLLVVATGSMHALAAERVTMPYYCTSLGGGAVELDPAPKPQSYAIVGPHNEASYRHCAPEDPSRCKTWKVHRFEIDCGGKPVPWYRVVAAASEITGGPAFISGTRLNVRLRQDGGGPQDVAVMPPGFAPVVGLTADIGGSGLAATPPVALQPPVPVPAKPPASAPQRAEAASSPKPDAATSSPPPDEGASGGTGPADKKSAPIPAAAGPSEAAAAEPSPVPAAPPSEPKLAPGVIALPPPVATNKQGSDNTTITPSTAPPPPSAPAPASPTPAATESASPAAAPAATGVAGTDGTGTAPVAATAPRQRLGAVVLLAAAALLALLVLVRLMRRRPASRPVASTARDLAAVSFGERSGATEDLAWTPAGSSPPPEPALPEPSPAVPAVPQPELPSAEVPLPLAEPPPQPAPAPLAIDLPRTRAEALEMLGAPPDASLDAARKIVDGLRQSWSPALAKTDADRQKREAHVRAIDAVWAVVERDPKL